MYSSAFKDLLQRGALQLRTKDKSGHYFELGTKFAWVTEDVLLASSLIRAITTRLQYIVEVTLGNPPFLEAEETRITYPLSISEEVTYAACKSASSELVEWRNGDSRTLTHTGNSIVPRELLCR